jgi:hypothetical protein
MERRPKGFWFLIGVGIFLNLMYLSGQTMAVIDYQSAVSMGLQESTDQVTQVGVALNKGFGLGDTIVYIPLFVAGIFGLIKKTSWGIYTMMGALAITVYWPVVSLATLYFAKTADGWSFDNYTSYSILLLSITVYGCWGIWYLFKHRHDFS